MSTATGGRANFWLGLTVGAILGAAVLFSIYYVPRKGLNVSADSLPFTVVLVEAHGLHVGSPVLISGVEAGEVDDVQIRELPGVGWRVLASVEVFDAARFGPALRSGSLYAVRQSGLLGETVLDIAPGGAGPPLLAGALVDGTPPQDFTRILDDVATISARLADFMDGRGRGDPSLRRALTDLQGMLRNLRDFSDKLPK
jgi:ABC-type transporter Mla subunit MlaD